MVWIAGACLSGIVAVLIPFQLAAAVAAVVAVTVLALHWPNIIGIVILILAFGALPFVPLDYRLANEAAILWAIALGIFYWLTGKEIDAAPIREFKAPLLLFCLAWVIALIQGYAIAHLKFAIPDSRRYVGLLAVLIFAALEGRKGNSGFIHRLILSFGTLSSVLLLLQLGTGWRVFAGLKGFMEGGIGAEYSDVVRGSAEGGDYFMAYGLFYSLFLLIENPGREFPRRATLIGQVILNAAGLVAIFSRGIWAGLVLGLFLLLVFCRNRLASVVKVSSILAILGASLVLMAYPIFPRQVEAVFGRLASISEEGGKGTSMGARFDENQQALKSIVENPVLGLGHGGEYKKTSAQVSRGFVNEITFIHNSYLWVAIKLGLLGIVSILFLVAKYIKISFRLRSSKDPTKRAIGTASACTLATWLTAGIIAPVWAQASDLVAFSALLVVIGSANTSQQTKRRA